MKVFIYNDFVHLLNVKSAIAISYNSFNDDIYIYFIKNGKAYNSNSYAAYWVDLKSYHVYAKYYYFYDLLELSASEISNKQWKKKVKEIKRSNKLKIFQ